MNANTTKLSKQVHIHTLYSYSQSKQTWTGLYLSSFALKNDSNPLIYIYDIYLVFKAEVTNFSVHTPIVFGYTFSTIK